MNFNYYYKNVFNGSRKRNYLQLLSSIFAQLPVEDNPRVTHRSGRTAGQSHLWAEDRNRVDNSCVLLSIAIR